jgi:hypothetical protein
MATLTTKTISAQNTFTDAVLTEGYFNISISGTFVATVTVQRSWDASTWYDVNTFTAPFQGTGFDPEYTYYRAGVKTSAYTSGDVIIRFGSEDKEEH